MVMIAKGKGKRTKYSALSCSFWSKNTAITRVNYRVDDWRGIALQQILSCNWILFLMWDIFFVVWFLRFSVIISSYIFTVILMLQFCYLYISSTKNEITRRFTFVKILYLLQIRFCWKYIKHLQVNSSYTFNLEILDEFPVKHYF